jgi:hypothetical protein
MEIKCSRRLNAKGFAYSFGQNGLYGEPFGAGGKVAA